MYTYSPPDCGRIAPSSAKVSAPKNESTPPTNHARYTYFAEPTASIIVPGTRKMPLPMIVPTTIAVAWLGPRARTSPCSADLCSLATLVRPLGIVRGVPEDQAGNIPDGERHRRADHHVPRPRHLGREPYI